MLSNITNLAVWRRLTSLLSVICILLVLVGAASLASMRGYKSTVQNYDQEQNAIIALQASRMIEDKMEDLAEEVNLMAIGNLVAPYQGQECADNIKKYFEVFNGQMSNLARVGPDGVFRCSMNRSVEGKTIKEIAPFLEKLFADPKHAAVMSPGSPVPGQDTVAIAVHYPLFDKSGAFTGTIGGAVYLNQFGDKIFKNISVGNHRFVIVLDDDGTILYHPDTQFVGVNVNSPAFATLGSTNAPTYKGVLNNIDTSESGFVNFSTEGKQVVAAYDVAHVFPGRRWVVLVPVLPR